MNIFQHIARFDPRFAPTCVFDIGANIGQTVGQIRRAWPSVLVHAFEPISSTFAKLEENTADDAALVRHRLAFGSRACRAVMHAEPQGLLNRIVGTGSRKPPGRGPTEEVEVVMGDAFCAAQGITDIGMLKVDTEGHDLEVLVGFREMLAARRITYVEVECAIAPDNAMHVPLSRLSDFLFAFGYGLYNLYPGIRRNLNTNKPERGMWYGNAVFVAEAWPDNAEYA
ncbi:FkbM family methyltransferase [Roseomonas fluvialis]|uniref:Methyltransferase FkbM domain-containing protein n=1 Tax=Roseomonas fluvialis TaxID=1750527 RepID=A0ABN6P937_9PROT|nr:FkbM family methyltransferase [Roseomonas fluvialis]BDG74616.1 hypothetical protein Rmf_45450 [Roseomonas fluvialis]